MKYMNVLTNYIFRDQVGMLFKKKKELLFDLFLPCFLYCAVGGSQCAGQCGWNGSPKTESSSEIQLELLKPLLALAEHNGLPIETWQFSQHIYRQFTEYLDPAHEESGLTALNVLLYLTDLCSIPLILKLLPYFENRGFQLTAASVVAFVSNVCILERFERAFNRSDNTANLHMVESPYRVLLSKVTRNCCRDGQCWFRSSVLTSLCRGVIDWGFHAPSLLLLHLGVHDFTQYEDLVVGLTGDAPPAPTLLPWVHRYAPRGYIKSKQLPRHPEVCSIFPSPAPVRSLQELCRLSIRAALGHCRIEEKTEGLRGLLPDSLREYLYFHNDIFIFPAPNN
ncbi:uncharacterized protein LOC108676260 [Hyalella azteca]|uniref:Uncharacterized protein LOC108676260 n=1 Tax=Hyalella azteca TaxID=294128 RepID=A0A8B7P1A6_HYAAZ|nr:uncharacterized protein LOC108676260 [Hyalella azteca]XP_018019804.1 uncharacterized protein LOC108676260 [Hyalella azteca]